MMYSFALSLLSVFLKSQLEMDLKQITSIFYTVHLITVKAVKLTSASKWWRIYFCNNIIYWDPAGVLKTRPKELGSRTVWLKEFNVNIIIFYWIVVLRAMGIGGGIQQCRHKCCTMLVLQWQQKCCCKGFHICGLSFQVL